MRTLPHEVSHFALEDGNEVESYMLKLVLEILQFVQFPQHIIFDEVCDPPVETLSWWSARIITHCVNSSPSL